jgi:hypothetical protein
MKTRNLAATAAALACVVSLISATAGTYTWNPAGSRADADPNNNNNWDNPMNWLPIGVPGAGDTAIVGGAGYGNPNPAGDLQLYKLQIVGASVTVSSLDLAELVQTNGNLYGGTVSFTGSEHDAWTWAGGSISGDFDVRADVRADWYGPNPQVFGAGSTLDTWGEVHWHGGTLQFGIGHVWRNTGTILVEGNNTAQMAASGASAVLRNEGTFRKTSAGTTRFHNGQSGVRLDNSGTVEALAGTLQLAGPGVHTNGLFTMRSGAQLQFLYWGHSFFAGARMEIAGTATCNGATLAFYDTTNTVAGGGVFEVSAGWVAGNGTVAGPGTFRWTGGTLAGTQTILAGVALEVSGSGSKTLDASAQLLSHANGTWSGAGLVYGENGSLWFNTGTLDAQSPAGLEPYGSGASTLFRNEGMLRKSGTGTTLFANDANGARLENRGLVEVTGGLLQLAGGGTHSNGLFTVSSGGQLSFLTYPHTFSAGARMDIAGDVYCNSGWGLTFLDTTNTVTSGGVLTVSGGWVGGTGTVTGPGIFRWNGGTLAGTQTISAGATLEVSGSANKTLHTSAQLINHGTGTWSGAGLVYGESGSVWFNTGTLDAQSPAGLEPYGSGASTLFRNEVTLRKSGTGTTLFANDANGARLENRGTVEVTGGLLQLAGGGSHSNGLFTVSSGGQLSFLTYAHTFSAGARMEVAGDVYCNCSGGIYFTDTTNTVAAGGVLGVTGGWVGGTGTVTGPGIFRWTGGTLAGTQRILAGTTLEVSGSANKTLHTSAQLIHHGNGTWSGAGLVYGGNGSLWFNTGTLDAQSPAGLEPYGSGASTLFRNEGTLRKSGTGTTFFANDANGARLENRGTVEVTDGLLQLAGGGSHSNGLFAVSSGAQLSFPYYGHTFQAGARMEIAGTASVTGGGGLTLYDTTNTVSSGGVFLLSAATIAGTGTITGPGTFRWTGGTLAGTQTISAGTTLEVSGSANKTLDASAQLIHHGNGTWSGAGLVYGETGSVWLNTGTLDAQSPAGLEPYGSGASTLFRNEGTLRKSGTDTTVFANDANGARLENRGTVEVSGGLLQLAGGGSHSNGLFAVSSGAQLNFPYYGHALQAGARMEIAGTASVTGGGGLTLYDTTNTVLSGGVFLLSAATVAGTGTITGPGTFRWTGGTLAGTQTILAGTACEISGAASKYLATSAQFVSHGDTVWRDAGFLYCNAGSLWRNTGTVDAQTAAGARMNGSGMAPEFRNDGTLRKSGSGTTLFHNTASGVTFANNGTVDLRAGTLQVNGAYQPAAGAPFTCLLSSPVADSGHGKVARVGTLPLNGPLTVTLAPGYTPTNGSVFTLATYTARSGSFDPVNLPALPLPLFWSSNYTATSFQLSVVRGEQWLRFEQPTWPSNGVFQAQVLGSNVAAVVVQATTNFTDWTPVVTNSPFTGVFPFTDAAAGAFTNRFYRALTQP